MHSLREEQPRHELRERHGDGDQEEKQEFPCRSVCEARLPQCTETEEEERPDAVKRQEGAGEEAGVDPPPVADPSVEQLQHIAERPADDKDHGNCSKVLHMQPSFLQA